MTNVQLTLLPSILNVSEYQEHPLSVIRLDTLNKLNMINMQLTLLPSILNVSEYQEYPLSSIRLHT